MFRDLELVTHESTCTHSTFNIHVHTVCGGLFFKWMQMQNYKFQICYIYMLQLGSVQRYLNPKIKCREKYLFSHAPKHTIGNCSSRYVQIRCHHKIGQFLQKLKNLKSKIFYRLFVCTQKRCPVI